MCCLCDPLSLSVTWSFILIHDDYLCVNSDAIKVCFGVITEGYADIVGELLYIFQKHHAIEGQVVYLLTLAVGSDV